ncbi:MAG: SUMF1/EgtB/PvdO family nonheme iron enzyme [Schlesneria sp.]
MTVSEFLLFIENKGYESNVFWKSGGFGLFDEPEGWADQLAHKNRPVVGVSWFEAMAFCDWAAIRLPTESEWERVARGSSARKYPWGSEPPDTTHLNSDMKIGSPTPVGIFPVGATNDGVEDMAGNVWEWCCDCDGPYSEYPQINPTGPISGDSKILRGGSWESNSRLARSAFRHRNSPFYRSATIGFRVVSLIQGTK